MNNYLKIAVRCYSSARAPVGAVPTIHEHIWASLGEHGGRTAISCPESGKSLTYGRLRQLSGNIAAWLYANTPKGRQFVTILPNSIEMAISALGAFEAGVPLSPLNPQSTATEIAGMFAKIDPRWLVTTSSKIHEVLEAMKAANRTTKDTGIIAIDEEIIFNGVRFLDETVLQSGNGERYEDQPALMMVGAGRVEVVSASNILANCHQVSGPELNPLEPGDKIAASLPMFHNYGLTQTLLRGLASGAEVVTLNSSSPSDLVSSLNKSKVRVLPTISPMMDALAGLGRDALNEVKYITVGGRPDVASNKLKSVFNGELLHNYGPIEGPILFQQRRGVAGRPGSVGEPLPNTEAKVLAPGGAQLPEMTEGEIWVKGPQIGKSLEWIRTGDLGYMDLDGWFYVTVEGNVSVDGLKVVPSELEEVLIKHSSVRETVVFQSDGKLIAAIVPTDYYNPPPLKELSNHLESHLAPHKRISDVVIMSSLPKNESGYFDRINLEQNYNARHHEFVAVQSL
ncbi:4-coumarate--CoA ligase-like 4 [Cimex lectularius]|uniref:Uncharacterized protein n=1 Tax=Cimex lectularius TaxID=79782 RepID=A0A8I6RGY3_CIMLE|nr:4-coumarate--CoA ligase-like 4 [Cimex lectularius]